MSRRDIQLSVTSYQLFVNYCSQFPPGNTVHKALPFLITNKKDEQLIAHLTIEFKKSLLINFYQIESKPTKAKIYLTLPSIAAASIGLIKYNFTACQPLER